MIYILGRYRPTPYTSLFPALSGHLQTFFHELVREVPDLYFERYSRVDLAPVGYHISWVFFSVENIWPWKMEEKWLWTITLVIMYVLVVVACTPQISSLNRPRPS